MGIQITSISPLGATVEGNELNISGQTAGDVLYYDGTAWLRLAKGTANQRFSMNAGATAPEWQTVSSDAGEGTVTLFPNMFRTVGQGTWTTPYGSSYTFAHCLRNAAASAVDGDNISAPVYLAQGTYTMIVIYSRSTDHGIVDLYIDASEVGSFDGYAATDHDNEYAVTGINIASSGLKTFKVQIDGKNVLSSDYESRINCVQLIRTA